MTQEIAASPAEKPLNRQQATFARELGIAIAGGGRDADILAAYERAGYAPDRGNARRLAADPRVKAIADEACNEALRLAGLHIGYLQAKALELLHASPTAIHRRISKFMTCDVEQTEKGVLYHPRLRSDMTEAECAELDAVTWPLSKFKINEKGVIEVDVPDKRALIDMLAKQLGVGKDDSTVNVGVTLETLVQQAAQSRQAAKEAA
jgi:hypothetical protein